MATIAGSGRSPRRFSVRSLETILGVLLLFGLATLATADDLGDELLPLPPSVLEPTRDAGTIPAQVGGLLPDALPPSPSLPYDSALPPPTAPGIFFDRPALVAPGGVPRTDSGVLPPGEVPTPGMVANLPSRTSRPLHRGESRTSTPRIPEPMVFDLVRGLGARRGELEVNVLNLVPFRGDRRTRYEWAPEIEWAVFDGFALEFELPIFNTEIEATKYAAQYTFGTAFDDAFIHGIQGILQHTFEENQWSTAILYLAGIRLDRNWSLFGMFGFNAGELVFPFDDFAPRQGLDILVNLSVFYEFNDDFLFGVETNMARDFVGTGDILIMPQVHWSINEHYNLQFGVGVRDTGLETFPEIGFRVIWER